MRTVLFALVVWACSFSVSSTRAELNTPQPSPNNHCTSASGELNVVYLGNTTLVFCDGSSRIVIDGFVSRPSKWELLNGISPIAQRERVTQVIAELGISNDSCKDKPCIDAVIPLHSHYDHLMDAPIIVKEYGATLMGSEHSAALVAAALGDIEHKKEPIIFSADSAPYKFNGNYQLTLLPAAHAVPKSCFKQALQNSVAPLSRESEEKQINALKNICVDFSGWRWSRDMTQGQVNNILLRAGSHYFYVHGGHLKTDFTDHLNALGFDPSITNHLTVFISTPVYSAMLEASGQALNEIIEPFWRSMSEFSKVKVIPIHWDNFFEQLDFDKPLNHMTFQKKHNKEVFEIIDNHIDKYLTDTGSFTHVSKIGKIVITDD